MRLKDVDFDYRQAMIRDGKGAKDRVTMLPEALLAPLKQHLIRVKALHEKELADGYGDVELPAALHRNYPRAAYVLRPDAASGTVAAQVDWLESRAIRSFPAD